MITRSLAQGRRHRQRGAALLVFMLILIIGSGYLLLNKLNGHHSPWSRTTASYAALQQAKAALIGYAVSYPERSTSIPKPGPGYLPCPDRDNDGRWATEGACSQGGGTNIGRFPWRDLKTSDLRDSSGNRLWYAVSNNYRFNPQLEPLNSETPGQFTVDGAGDIVAVLIAPGEALSGQNRDTGPNTVGNYLEDDNADLDTAFVSRAAGAFNDRVMTITRQELMQAVERRVLGEVGSVLRNYRQASWNSSNVYPWLSPYSNPRLVTTIFKGVPGTTEGHLALHWPGEQFNAAFKVKWNLSNADITTILGGSITQDDLKDGDKNFTGMCTWNSDYKNFDCTGTAAITIMGACKGVADVPIDRQYQAAVNLDDPGTEIKPPQIGQLRQRSATLDATPLSGVTNFSMTLTDTASATVGSVTVGDVCGDGILTSNAGTGGELDVKDVPYALAVPQELPAWFFSNDWHHLIYVAEASGYAPDGGGTCTAGSDCLTVNNSVTPSNDKRLVLIAAGVDLGSQDRNTGVQADYFESENADGGPVFTRNQASAGFNDQLRYYGP